MTKKASLSTGTLSFLLLLVGLFWVTFVAAHLLGQEGEVLRVGKGITAPRLIHKVAPRYTPQALEAQMQGGVIPSVI